MASLDVRRPAAMEQLACSAAGQRRDLPIVAGQQPAQIAQRALQAGRSAASTSCCSTPPAAPRSTKR
jgi:signal recognition particle subunit SRP54